MHNLLMQIFTFVSHQHQLSKQLLDFKDSIPDAGCPTHVSGITNALLTFLISPQVFDEIDLKNVSNKKQKFKFEPVCPPTCQLTFTPASGTIEKVRLHLPNRSF